MMIPRYVIIMRFPVISQTDLFPEDVHSTVYQCKNDLRMGLRVIGRLSYENSP